MGVAFSLLIFALALAAGTAETRRRAEAARELNMLLAAIGLELAADASVLAARPGEITDKVPCAADPTLSYALYLPARFTLLVPRDGRDRGSGRDLAGPAPADAKGQRALAAVGILG